MPSEILSNAERDFTKEADIFSLGCSFFYALSDGTHPFESVFDFATSKVIENIKNDQFYIEKLKNYDEPYKKFCAKDLIKKMIAHNPHFRPSCDSVLNNPLFWDKYQIYKFIKKFKLIFKFFNEKNYEKIIGHDWIRKVDKKLLNKYSVNFENKNIEELIRFMSKSVS